MLSSVKIVVFDLGGVLVRVAQTWAEAADFAGVIEYDHEAAAIKLSEMPGFEAYQGRQIGLNEFLQRLRSILGLKSADEALKVHQGILMRPYPGTMELVTQLQNQGYKTGCLSNTNCAHWTFLRNPAHYPAIAALEVPLASHLVGLSKPEPEIYAAFEAQSGYSAREIIFFDDHPGNVEAARRAGWHAFPIDPLGDPVSQMRNHLGLAEAA